MEWNFYGSSRLGTRAPENPMILANRTYEIINNQISNENIPALATPSNKKFRKLGEKVFELVNHLGNILSTISDRKLMHEDLPNNAGYGHHYTAEILSTTEQYLARHNAVKEGAFGMEMPGRSFSVEEYRYGMNGQEKSDEIFKGPLTAEFWEYDSGIGRRWNMDPIFKEWESPFACFFNNPTNILDPFGLDGEGTNGECPGDISEDGTKTYGLDGTTGENRWHDNSYGVTIVENKNVSNNDWKNLTRNSLSPRVASSSMTMEIKENYEIKVPELKREETKKYDGSYLLDPSNYNYSVDENYQKFDDDLNYYLHRGPWYLIGIRATEIFWRDLTTVENRETVKAAALLLPVGILLRGPSKLVKGETYIDISKFTGRIKKSKDTFDPNTGYILSRTKGKPHGKGAIYKLKTPDGTRVGTFDETGEFIR